MKQICIISALMWLCFSLTSFSPAFASTDGVYLLSETTYTWDGSDASRAKATSADYDYGYGDEGSVTYNLPWGVSFYGVSYNQIVVDANGYIRFASPSTGHSFNLATTGMGPVIAPWNSDLSSYYYGGFFVQHKSNPERVVIEWQTETYTEEGFGRPSNFEAVLYQDGTIRFDYGNFTTQIGKDFGSGISKSDGTNNANYLSLTAAYGSVYSLSNRSFVFSDTTPPTISVNSPNSVVTSPNATLSGTMSGGAGVTVSTNCANCSSVVIGTVTYPSASTWSCPVSGLASGAATSFTITATRPGSGVFQSVAKSITYDPNALPVIITSPKGLLNTSTPTLNYTLLGGTVTGIKINDGALTATNGQQLPQLADGAYTIVIEYTDGGVPGSVSSQFTLDTLPPVLTICAPPSPLHSAPLTLSGTVEADLPVTVTVSGGASVGAVTTTGTTWTCVVTGLAIGDATITATAVDAAGNGMLRTTTVTYIPLLHTTVTPSAINAGQTTTIQLAVTNLPDAAATVLVEQLVDINRNGIADSADYAIRSFTVKDGTASADPGVVGDSDGAVNGSITVNLPSYLLNDMYHAPGNYLFRVTQGSSVWTAPFTVTPVLQGQSIAGSVNGGDASVPGAIIQLADNTGRQLSYSIADENGSYILQAAVGSYLVTPLAYGYSGTAQVVTVSSGQQITGIDLALVSGTYHLTGRVKDSTTNTGIGGVWVTASGISNAVALTAADGSYNFTLPSGTYQVAVAGDASRPNPASVGYLALGSLPLTVALTADSIGNDLALPKATTLVSGRVLDQSGNALAGIPVTARLSGDSREPYSSRPSGGDGTYSLPLISGSQWSIYPDYQYAAVHNLIGSVISPYITTGQATGNDLTVYPVTAWVSGVVKDSANTLLGAVEVVLRNSASTVKATTVSAADGSYHIGAFAGTWYVDALTEKIGTRPVAEQTVTLTASQTASLDFVADVTPPDLTINVVTTPTTLTSQTIGGTMEAGATVSVSVNTTAVAGAVSHPTSTTWSCHITALANGANTITVTAADEAGNSSTVSSSITYLSPYPDLVVTSVVPSSNSMVTGQAFTAQVTVKNQGGVTANNSYVGFYFSADNVINSSDTRLATSLITSIAPGEIKVLTIPSYVEYSTIKGTYYYGAIADYNNQINEVDKTNNAKASSPVTIDYGQDLVVTSVVPSSNSMVTGQSFTVQVKVKNLGSVTSQPANVGLYFSTDDVINSSDARLATATVSNLAPNEERILTIPSSVDYSTIKGTYYYGAIADYNYWINEADETNNTKASSPVTIDYGQDLTVTAVDVSSNALVTGQTFTVQVKVKNLGSVTSQSATVGLYLSTDNVINSNDSLLATSTVSNLAPNEERILTIPSFVDYSTIKGTYYYGAIVDYNSRINEANETNNAKASSPVTIDYGQDLVVTSVVPSSNSMVTGQSFTVQVKVKNLGSVTSQPANVGLYFSTDNVINSSDARLATATVSNLAPNEERILTISSYVDYSTIQGTYYYGAIVDYNYWINESDENNNTLASAAVSIGYGQDLTAISLSTPGSPLTSGQSVTIPVTIKNQGSVLSQQVPVTLYLSVDNVINSSDTWLGERTVTNLSPNAQQTLNFPVTIPNMAPGAYYFGIIVDRNNVAKEGDETNNVTVSAPTQIVN